MFSREGKVLLDRFILNAFFWLCEKRDPIKAPNSAWAWRSDLLMRIGSLAQGCKGKQQVSSMKAKNLNAHGLKLLDLFHPRIRRNGFLFDAETVLSILCYSMP
jgi:hypothetical protein